MDSPTESTLTLAPQRRFEAIDVNARIYAHAGDVLRVTAARSKRESYEFPAEKAYARALIRGLSQASFVGDSQFLR